MKRNISIQLKAVLLLVVFGLNTVVGFACAMGVNMGFNGHHHDEEATAVSVHIHADGKKHHHDNRTNNHQHSSKKGKGNCCNNEVAKFSQVDKSIPPSNTNINPLFFTLFVSSIFDFSVSCTSQVNASSKYFARNYHPPIPDIRIAIQSFQI